MVAGRRSHSRSRADARRPTTVAIALVAVVLALTARAVPALAAAGVPAAPTTVFTEDFEHEMGTRPVLLTGYTGAPPVSERYTADPVWLTACNGVVLEFASPDSDLGFSGCPNPVSYGRVRQLAYALGVHIGAADPTTNHGVTAYTENNPGANRVEFATASDIPLPANGRFVTFSVDTAALNCDRSAPQYQFYLTSGASSTPVGGLINACGSTTTLTAPARGAAGATETRIGTYTSTGALLFSGSALGLRMTNPNGSFNGNDAAFDNIRILDVTPTLDKSFSPADLNAGGISTLTFTITNTSELAAKAGWSFTDELPAGLAIATPAAATTSCPGGQVTTGTTSIAVRGDLAAGQSSCTVTVGVTSRTAGAYVNGPGNVTTVGLNPPQPATVAFRSADLSIVKTATSTPAAPGGQISYELTVRNAGPDTAVNARVADTLPAGLTFASASPGCSASGPAVTCAIGDLAAGGSRTFTVTAGVDDGLEADTLANTATVASDTLDPDPGDDSDEETVPVQPLADLAIVKRAQASRPVPGRRLAYELVVTNLGPSPARAISVRDALPRGLSFVSASSGCAFTAGTVTCTAGSLAAGRSLRFDVVTSVASSLTGSVANTATVASATRDPEPGNNRWTERLPSGPEAGLSIAKVPSVGRVAVGGQLFYTLLVSNAGPSDAADVVVSDAAGGGLTLLSASASQGGACSVTAAKVTCSVGTVAAGGTAQVLVSARADQVGELPDRATVASATPDPDPRDDSQERTVTGEQAPPPQPADLAIVKASDRRAVTGGGTITYTLRVRNRGPGVASGVQVFDTPSLPIRVRSVRSSVGRCTTTVPIRCDLGTLAVGARATVTIVAGPLAPGSLRNSASVTGDVPDPDARDNIDRAVTSVRGLLRIRKVAGRATVRAGGTVGYAIAVTNASAFALRSVRVCDDPPAGLVLLASTPASRLSGGRRCWTVAALAAGERRTFTVRARVLRGVRGRKVNTATATAPGARGARSRAATGTATIRVLPIAARGGGVTG